MQLPRIDVPEDLSFNHCFACGEDNPIGLKLKPSFDGEKVRAVFTPGDYHQGWHDITHGGIIYTLLDEVTAYALLCAGTEFGVTVKSEIRFKDIAPTGRALHTCAWTTRVTRRLIETQGEASLDDGTLVAEASSQFYAWSPCSRAFLWDMDGVITDSAPFHLAAWRDALSRRGARLTDEQFRKLFGTRNDHIVRNVLGQGTPEQVVQMVVEDKEATYRQKIEGRITPLPGVMNLLEAMRRGKFKLALTSSAPRKNIDLVNGALHLEDYFTCIVSGDEVARSKPSPDIYLKGAEKLGVKAKNCLVIEDSPFGVEGAKSAGMKCLGIAHGRPNSEFAQADKVVDSIKDVDLITLIRWI